MNTREGKRGSPQDPKEVAMDAEKKRKFITIVYDPGLRSLLQDFFDDDQYEVESASDGLEAFHKLAKKYFDLIITDCQMPGLGGVDLLPRLKRIHPWARVIVLPAKRMKRQEKKIMESAADVYLVKPFQLNDLKMIIQRMFHAPDDKPLPTEEGWKSGRLSMEVG
jgi:DNA-binding response OmpR family regulator